MAAGVPLRAFGDDLTNADVSQRLINNEKLQKPPDVRLTPAKARKSWRSPKDDRQSPPDGSAGKNSRGKRRQRQSAAPADAVTAEKLSRQAFGCTKGSSAALSLDELKLAGANMASCPPKQVEDTVRARIDPELLAAVTYEEANCRIRARSSTDDAVFDEFFVLNHLRACHRSSERGRPSSDKILAHVDAEDRTFIISITLKVRGHNDFEFRDVLWLLGEKCIPVVDIFQDEYKILVDLGMEVSHPAAVEILDCMIEYRNNILPAVAALARFFLCLSLFDAHLHFRYPHVILAAAALQMAAECHHSGTDRCGVLFDDAVLQSFMSETAQPRKDKPWSNVIEETIDHGEPPAPVPPREVERALHAQWEAVIERRKSAVSASKDMTSLARESVVVLSFTRHSKEVATALLQSPPAVSLSKRNIDVSPPWANGAKIFVEGIGQGDIEEARASFDRRYAPQVDVLIFQMTETVLGLIAHRWEMAPAQRMVKMNTQRNVKHKSTLMVSLRRDERCRRMQ